MVVKHSNGWQATIVRPPPTYPTYYTTHYKMPQNQPNDSPDDSFDRETFYDEPEAEKEPEAESEEDYELMPPDAEVIAGEQRRAHEAITQAEEVIDVNDLYDSPASIEFGDFDQYLRNFRLRYTTRHLLIAMGVLAVLLTLGRFVLGGFAPLLLVLVFTTLASAYGYIRWQEHQRYQEWQRKRDELYRRHHQNQSDEE